jgi:hypothetical protein
MTYFQNCENNLQTTQTSIQQKGLLSNDPNSAPSTINRQSRVNHHDSGFDIESTANTIIPSSESQSFENLLAAKKNIEPLKNNTCINTNMYQNANIETEKLRNDLDEVEELTTRVRDSISVDLSSTRRYSPLLYEYYRKQLELAKSIQSTYNIQCNTLFDAMTLMRKCLKDYCQSVHNPEYFAIDSFQNAKNGVPIFQTKLNPISNFIQGYDLKNGILLPNQLPNLNLNKSLSFNNTTIVNRQLKHMLSSNTFSQRNKNDSANNTFLSSESTSATTSTTSSPSVLSTNLASTTQLEVKLTIENKQTYV